MKELNKDFIGRGEVKGFQFEQVMKHPLFYVYRVTINYENKAQHYELFKRKINTYYNQESYPSSKSFGVWAWTLPTLERVKESIKEHFGIDVADVKMC